MEATVPSDFAHDLIEKINANRRKHLRFKKLSSDKSINFKF